MANKTLNNYELIKNRLTPLKSSAKKTHDFVGFDVETFGDDNKFMSGGLYWEDKKGEHFEYFDNGREEMIQFLLRRKFAKKTIIATNLDFDITVLFYGTKYWNHLQLITRSGSIMCAKYQLKNSHGTVTFLDTMNYCPYGVAKLGNIIGINKLQNPSWMGERTPNSLREALEMQEYNKIDCKITKRFADLLQEGYTKHGGTMKISSASTSLDTWRRGYQKIPLYKEDLFIPNIKDFIFDGYYGGRTEVFSRGKIENAYYYDINSLYPSVMVKDIPLPQSVKEIQTPDIAYINDYEGVSKVTIHCPNMMYPVLPYKTKEKLLFPTGTFTGTYNHNELRYALKQGYEILSIEKQIVYEETFTPFKDFVNDLYDLRLEYKKQGSPMQLVIKLLMNSLYGKFAQKRIEEFKIYDTNNMSEEEERQFIQGKLIPDDAELKNGRYYSKEEKEFNGKHSFPIISSYITSYARIVMHKYISEYEALYTDTDSIITMKQMPDSKTLGEMKLECEITTGYLVKPKFYMIDDQPKVKGVSRIDNNGFLDLLEHKSVSKMKFSKLRESYRRDIPVNSKIVVDKTLSLEDNKRVWESTFNKNTLQRSIPIEVYNEH